MGTKQVAARIGTGTSLALAGLGGHTCRNGGLAHGSQHVCLAGSHRGILDHLALALAQLG